MRRRSSIRSTRVGFYAQLIARDLPWFTDLNGIRTKLVHRGNTVRILTDGSGLDWRLEGADSEDSLPADLLTSLQSLTREMLEFSNDLSLVVATDEQLKSHPQRRPPKIVWVAKIKAASTYPRHALKQSAVK